MERLVWYHVTDERRMNLTRWKVFLQHDNYHSLLSYKQQNVSNSSIHIMLHVQKILQIDIH